MVPVVQPPANLLRAFGASGSPFIFSKDIRLGSKRLSYLHHYLPFQRIFAWHFPFGGANPLVVLVREAAREEFILARFLKMIYRRDCFAGSAASVSASVAHAVPAVEMN